MHYRLFIVTTPEKRVEVKTKNFLEAVTYHQIFAKYRKYLPTKQAHWPTEAEIIKQLHGNDQLRVCEIVGVNTADEQEVFITGRTVPFKEVETVEEVNEEVCPECGGDCGGGLRCLADPDGTDDRPEGFGA